jgi:hypothetical protein
MWPPSFYAHIINGLLMIVAFILIYQNYTSLTTTSPYRKVMLVLVLALVIGIHGISHHALEATYGFNPLE